MTKVTTFYSDVPVIGIVPGVYSANEEDGVVSFRVELLGGVLANDVMVEFYTESGSAEGKFINEVVYTGPLGAKTEPPRILIYQ